jgi:GNAT superfamily N-acetyltransferase
MSLSRTLLILIALLPLACGDDREERAFDPFERLDRLVFLPAGPCVLFPLTTRPVDCSTPNALLVDAFEVTRREWLAGQRSPANPDNDVPQEMFWEGGGIHLPATGMTRAEAAKFAFDCGMRLPTAKEWIRIAAGTRAQQFPWKPVSHASVANTSELGLGELAAVGTFHGGRTPSGIHDLSGNAAEWVSDRSGLTGSQDGGRWEFAMGGSFLTRQRQTYWFDSKALGDVGYNAVQLNPGHRGRDVGMRLVVEAEEWILQNAPAWPTGGAQNARLLLVGERWGSGALPLLRRLRAEHPELDALGVLLKGAEG